MRVARVRAQAKVNLLLQVFAERDAEGYHGVWTLLQRIDLADDVVVRLGGGSRSLDVTGPHLPSAGLGPVEKNLAYRAAVAYIEHPQSTLSRGFSIELTKNIPAGGGLGGGSADAGAVLRACNALSARPLDDEQLQSLAASLGSDVPFLASEHVIAAAAGRGHALSPVAFVPPASPMLVVVPDFSVATKDAYSWLDSDRPVDPYGDVTGFGGPDRFPGWSSFASEVNDFEPVIEKRYPALRTIRDELEEAGAGLVRLAGSGSSVFGVFDVLSWSTLDHDMFDLQIAALGGDVIRTRTSARVVEVEVLQ